MMKEEAFSIQGRFLVKGRTSNNDTSAAPVLLSDTPLSFWGGIDPETAIVCDRLHPLFGECVSNTGLCLPSGRGSCTASQVLLELILSDKAPRAIILRDTDGLVCVGALVAQEVFECQDSVPDIVCVGKEGFDALLSRSPAYVGLTESGCLVAGNSISQVQEAIAQQHQQEKETASTTELELTKEEESMLQNCTTDAEQMALKVLIRYAHLTAPPDTSPSYIDVTKAHIDGCTYIGNGGLRFVQRLVETGGKVKIPTTLNSVSADRRRWQQFGVPADRALASIAVGDAYLALGCHPNSFTCAPYLLEDPPKLQENIVWGESNAVVYANSVLGARTEKYADYLDIASALVGKVPAAGVHLDENRQPGIVLDASDVLQQIWDDECDLEVLFPTLGHLCGSLSEGKVPILLGLDQEPWSNFVSKDHLKAFCAAYGTTGTSPLIHIAGVTPEAQDAALVEKLIAGCGEHHRVVTLDDLTETHASLDAAMDRNENDISLIALGNPHLSVSECAQMAELISRHSLKTKHPDVRIMACMSRALYDHASDQGYVQKLESFGVEFVNDTCWCMLLDQPVIPSDPNAVILTNSGKYSHYGPGLTGRQFRFGSMADCVQVATTRTFPRSISWLSSMRQRRTYATIHNPLRESATTRIRYFLTYARRWR